MTGSGSALAWSSRLGRGAVFGVPVAAGVVSAGLAFAARSACWAGGAWNVGVEQYQAHCYSDIYPLYFTEGLVAHKVPYTGHPVEYPVIIGAIMQAAAWVVRSVADPFARGVDFFYVTVGVLSVFLVAGVVATAYCAGPARRWTALAVAFSPALILAAFINWDLVAMGLMMMSLAAWASRRTVLAGILLGLAVATKFYPVVALWPLFLLCLRAGRLRSFWITTASAAAAWLAVNLPVAIAAPSGWATFYSFSSNRGADWGGIWYYLQYLGWPVLGTHSIGTLNLLSALLFCSACVAIGALALAAPRRPRLAQLLFLTTAAFLLTSKVWSPQYVVWLVPLVVLARPRWGGYLIWQIAEVGYFYAIWAYLIFVLKGIDYAGAISASLYFTALLARFGTVCLLSALVARECLRPELDVVRDNLTDDPMGGVLAGAPDARLLRRWRPPVIAPIQSAH